MKIYLIKKYVGLALVKGSECTSHDLACKVWPDYPRSPLKPGLHPMSNQVSMVLKEFPNVVKDKKTKKYKVR